MNFKTVSKFDGSKYNIHFMGRITNCIFQLSCFLAIKLLDNTLDYYCAKGKVRENIVARNIYIILLLTNIPNVYNDWCNEGGNCKGCWFLQMTDRSSSNVRLSNHLFSLRSGGSIKLLHQMISKCHEPKIHYWFGLINTSINRL